MPTLSTNTTKIILSSSVGGRGILAAAGVSPGTLIHTASTNPLVVDEVWLWASNPHATDYLLTIEFGGTTDPNDLIVDTIDARSGLILVVPGMLIQGHATAKLVKAFADTASKLSMFGFALRHV